MEACCSRFTAAEGGARLAAAASTKNILAVEYSSFIAVRLLYEKAFQIRGSLFDGRKRSAYVTRASRVPVIGFELRILTDLAVVEATGYSDVYDWSAELDTKEVIVCTSEVLKRILEEELLNMTSINVLVLDSCHRIYEDDNLKYIMQKYKRCTDIERPIILALTYPLFTSTKKDNDKQKDTEETREESKDIVIRENENNRDVEELNSVDIKSQNLVGDELKCQDIEKGESNTQISEDSTGKADSIGECKEIALIDGKSENEIAARDLKKRVDKSSERIGVYVNMDDFDMYEKLEWKIEEMERELCCQMDLAEDIDGGKRLSSSTTKPRELIIEYSGRPVDDQLPEDYVDLEKFMRDAVDDAMEFMKDHRHDPTEIYGDELYEEFKNIPDPTLDPKHILNQFLYVLDQLGPYAADKAAFSLLTKLEKLKIKVPYERHFLLLCLCTTVLVKIRCYADTVFSKYESDWKKIQTFCTPKVLRFGEILEKFQPPELAKIDSDKIKDTQNKCGINQMGTVSKDISGEENDNNKFGISEMDTVSENIDGAVNDIVKHDITQMDTVIEDINAEDNNIDKNGSRQMDTVSMDINNEDNNITKNQLDIEVNNSEINTNETDINFDSKIATKTEYKKLNVNKMISDIEKCDFTTLGDKIQDRINIYEANLKDIDDLDTNINNIDNSDTPLNTSSDKDISLANTTTGNTSTADIVTSHTSTHKNISPSNTSVANTPPDNNTSTDISKVDTSTDKTTPANISAANTILDINTSPTNTSLANTTTANTSTTNTVPVNTTTTNTSLTFSPPANTSITNTTPVNTTKDTENNQTGPKGVLGLTRRSGHRMRGRSRIQRGNAGRVQLQQQNPDALCAIVYMKEPLVAKIMFMLIVDMSRCNPRLSYLCAQYCATEQPADPGTEPKECQRQGKKQEEVLKKFRMHECNLLLATSALEEGIDLPRCNLVLRWDVPPSYRSYGVCRGRARAVRATAAMLCSYNAETTDYLLHNLATYRELDQIISRKCGCGIQDEPPQSEEDHADTFTALVKPYTPNDNPDILKNDNNLNTIESNEKVIININDEENHSIIITKTVVSNDNNDETKKSDIESVNNEEICVKMSEFDIAKHDGKNHRDCVSNTQVINDNEDNDTHEKGLKSNSSEETNDIIDRIHDLGICEIADGVDNSPQIEKADTRVTITEVENDDESTINIANKNNIKEQNENKDTIKNECNDIKINSHLTNLIETDNTEQAIVNNDEFNDNIPKSNVNNDNTIKSEVNFKMNDEISAGIMDNKTNINCSKCGTVKSNDLLCPCVISYKVNDVKKNDSDSIASVDLSTAIALINRYCGKLPSDTFTRLAPQWWVEDVQLPVPGSNSTRTAYICTLRLPLNCPVKYNIVGHPMPTKVLARRMVALQACRILHKSGELDDQLMPIGKENFKAVELDASGACAPITSSNLGDAGDCARPGTTKRRQYYYKRTALAFTDCQPVEDTSDSEIDPPSNVPRPEAPPKMKQTKPGVKRNMLYALVSTLCCALPERYNTRGRRLHAPQLAKQAMGLLMARHEPDSLQIPAFPVYTRSGEVRVSVEHVPDADVRLSPRRGRLVRRFMRFVFSDVLRVRRRGMKLQSEGSTHNNYYIVPTVKTTRDDGTTKIDIDWAFLELIYQHTEEKKQAELEKPVLWNQNEEGSQNLEEEKETKEKPKEAEVKKMENSLLKPGETFVFDPEKYKEAVVTPWYRNQDQPQFFLVAEICWNLTPDSAFPSATHTSFRDYYSSKYGVTLTQRDQPLLDVDHTSARLNLLTPRYVNRKGVALPVSSERTRRAKRDRLDQKQILIPELCRVHPFAAPLWFATVALPCVLYRINALLIADEIRRSVAIDVGLGIPKISDETLPGFQWPALDFGWSLAEVLNADSEKNEKKKEEDSKREHKELKEKGEEENPKGEDEQEGPREKTINDILQEKEGAENAFEIGTWSNDMASSIPEADEYDEYMQPLPPNLTFCTSASGGANWCDPIDKPKSLFNPTRTYSVADSDCTFISSDLDSDDSDLDFDGSDEDTDTSGFCSSKYSNAAMGVRIEYKTAHEAEAVDLERNKKVNPAPLPDPADDEADRAACSRLVSTGPAPDTYIQKFRDSVTKHKQDIVTKGHLIAQDQKITQILPELKGQTRPDSQTQTATDQTLAQLFPFGHDDLTLQNGQIDLASIERNKRKLLTNLKETLSRDDLKKLNCFSMVDIDIDSPGYVNEKVSNVGFDKMDSYEELSERGKRSERGERAEKERSERGFEFDYQPKLENHPGPSPSLILQALTMSNANDGINLERLETIGDSFLKFAITAYLYCAHPTVHEGKLSHMRSKQVSNLNLYRLGRSKRLGARMIASKFEPHDNWLPPCHKPPHTHHTHNAEGQEPGANTEGPLDAATGCFIPYNLITQHSIPDKSIADCVEALIGAYLLECGPRGALLFMAWLGIRVLPSHRIPLPDDHPAVRNLPTVQKPPPTPCPKRQRSSSTSSSCSSSDEECQPQQQREPQREGSWSARPAGCLPPCTDGAGRWILPVFGELKAPPSPLLRYIEDPEGELEQMLSGYDELEKTLQYRFKDRSLLLQALTHASHQSNRLTDCYQRLEFLGDAILDYLITRHLYEDPRRHSPGALTDLRSALVNNTIFATLAARHGFHKYFRHMSPGLNEVLTKYVKIQEENGHSISEEHYLIQEDEMEQAEDVEVPKALGDLFESVAGAIFLDSGMSLDAVWKSYVNLMGAELEAFSAAAPKSPVRELLEAEPDTAKFGKPERLADGRRVRVCVEVFGRGAFKGVGRNYRIAKGTAARCALRHLRARRSRY